MSATDLLGLSELMAEAWAMEPTRLEALFAQLGAARATDLAAARRGEEQPEQLPFELRGSTAVIRVSGVMLKRVPWWARYFGMDATSIPDTTKAVQAASADGRVRTILLAIDSPGGVVSGTLELADAVHDARTRKKVVASIGDVGASGAYWLASQAEEISAGPNAMVGSIGVYRVVVDSSKRAEDLGYRVHVVRSGEHKGAGEPGAPITSEQLAAMQELIEGMARNFQAAVARGRSARLTPEQVQELATGKVWLAGHAQALGLVDRVEPVERVMNRYTPQEAAMSTPNDDTTKAVQAAIEAERARVSGVMAAIPEDPKFASEQASAGKTVEQAKAAYADVLRLKLQEQEKKTTQALAEAEKARASASTSIGAPPLAVGGEGAPEQSPDFPAQARAYAAEKKCSVRQAMSDLAARNPQGHADWKASQPRVRRGPTLRRVTAGQQE